MPVRDISTELDGKRSDSDDLLRGILMDTITSSGLALLLKTAISLLADLFGSLSLLVAFKTLNTRLVDIERQELYAAASTTCSPCQWALVWNFNEQPDYLHTLVMPKERKVFSMALFPSRFTWGRFKGLDVQAKVMGVTDLYI